MRGVMLNRRFWRGPFAVLIALATLAGLGSGHQAASQELDGPFSDGCYYWLPRGGSDYTASYCLTASGTYYKYTTDGQGGWEYSTECFVADARSAPGSFMGCPDPSGGLGFYVETYEDGSTYMQMGKGYVISCASGKIAETGHYNSAWEQITSGPKMCHSYAVQNRSLTHQVIQAINVQTVCSTSTSAACAVSAADVGGHASCLWTNPSGHDYDLDGLTGLTELSEYCATRV